MKYQVQFKNPHTNKWEPAHSPITKISTFSTIEKATSAMNYMKLSKHKFRIIKIKEIFDKVKK